jgi:hypothetical protein
MTDCFLTIGEDADYMLGITSWLSTVNTVDKFVGWSAEEFRLNFLTTFSVEPTYMAASAFAGT